MNCREGCSPPRRGGEAAPFKKMLRSLLIKAQTGWSVPDNVSTSTFTIMTTPSAPLRRLRVFFLLAQPPLLFQEGNTLSWQFIHTFIERRYSCSTCGWRIMNHAQKSKRGAVVLGAALVSIILATMRLPM